MNDAALMPRGRARHGLWARWSQRLRTVGELCTLFFRSGRWWLIPFVVVMLLTAGLLLVVHVIEYAAPFVYTLF